jgi:hypothetical protein
VRFVTVQFTDKLANGYTEELPKSGDSMYSSIVTRESSLVDSYLKQLRRGVKATVIGQP